MGGGGGGGGGRWEKTIAALSRISRLARRFDRMVWSDSIVAFIPSCHGCAHVQQGVPGQPTRLILSNPSA